MHNPVSDLSFHARGRAAGEERLSSVSTPTPLLECGSPRVVPVPVRQFSVVFDSLDADLGGHPWSSPPETDHLHPVTPRRRFEFFAGRYCVAGALRRLGHAPDFTVRRGPDGAPVWPVGITGSITHTRGFATAAVAFTTQAGGVGIDSEGIISAARARRLTSLFATEAEVNTARAAGLDDQSSATLTFSAKEAIFKCLHGSVRRVFDFHDVRIIAVDGGGRRFEAMLLTTLASAFPAGYRIEGRFDVDGLRVHTGVVVAPVALE